MTAMLVTNSNTLVPCTVKYKNQWYLPVVLHKIDEKCYYASFPQEWLNSFAYRNSSTDKHKLKAL